MSISLRYLLVAVIALVAVTSAHAKAPLEAFGDVPQIRSVELSPDGKRMVYLRRQDNRDFLVLHDLETRVSTALSAVTEMRARSVRFVGDNYVILTVSDTTRIFGFRGRHEISGAYAFNLSTKKTVGLLLGTEGMYPGQSSFGQIAGVDPNGTHVFMPVYMGTVGSEPTLDLLRVNLETGRGVTSGGKGGTPMTIDWIMDSKGGVVAREDFSEKRLVHEVRVFEDGKPRKIFSEETPLLTMSLIGTSSQTGALLLSTRQESDFLGLYEMSRVDGSVTGPVFEKSDTDIDDVIADQNGVVYGVQYSGLHPSYAMFDPKLNADIAKVQAQLGSASMWIDSWSSDWSKILLFAEGGSNPERYILLDRSTDKLSVVAFARPEIKKEDVGEVTTINYKARDGLTIPGLITWPVGVAEADRKNLPLIVMPHGGPESYDAVGFDWLAQYLANEGYVVLQPNFRGSSGFGGAFRDAGRKQWGRKMQDDISDGAQAVAAMGWADPARTCILGWSYGGYAALAGGAFTPDLYKCVVSIAGVSDLRDMLAQEKLNYGPRSRVVTYWEELIGDPDKDRAAIDAVSPARHAANFKAPVLLIHGGDDTVVPSKQSLEMESALNAAGKEVTHVRIKGDDHSLVDNVSRRAALEIITAFLATHTAKQP